MTAAKSSAFLGKFRVLILTIALFLVFDLGVLILNYFISFQIQQDASQINLAGRQRMLSQRMTKAVLMLQAMPSPGPARTAVQTELESTAQLFDTTLTAFAEGREVTGADGNSTVQLRVSDPRAQSILLDTLSRWQDIQPKLKPLFSAQNELDAAALSQAVAALSQGNLRLLDNMNQLTGRLEREASQKGQRLRWIQAGAMILALVNFVLIVFHFLKQLRAQEEAVEAYAEGLTRMLTEKDEALRQQKQQWLTMMSSVTGAKVDDTEASRRRRAVLSVLTQFLSGDTLWQAMWLWEDDYNALPAINIYPFIKRASQTLQLDWDRNQVYVAMLAAMPKDLTELGPDPWPDMQRFRRQKEQETSVTDPGNHWLKEMMAVLRQLDNEHPLRLRAFLADHLHEMSLSPEEMDTLREWCLRAEMGAQLHNLHPQSWQQVRSVMQRWASQSLAPVVADRMFNRPLGLV